jgi:hypothetical protein
LEFQQEFQGKDKHFTSDLQAGARPVEHVTFTNVDFFILQKAPQARMPESACLLCHSRLKHTKRTKNKPGIQQLLMASVLYLSKCSKIPKATAFLAQPYPKTSQRLPVCE